MQPKNTDTKKIRTKTTVSSRSQITFVSLRSIGDSIKQRHLGEENITSVLP